jgi:hypothetical protein
MKLYAIVAALALLLGMGCEAASTNTEVLKRLPVDDTEGLLTQSGVALDHAVTSDGAGALRIDASGPTVVRLYEVSGLSVEDARLIYRARVRTENLEGQAFLEMWCVFPGTGEYFSRSLQSPLSGTVEWSTQETPFFLQKGQRPDLVKLNVVVNGRGTIWIDDIVLSKGPLK